MKTKNFNKTAILTKSNSITDLQSKVEFEDLKQNLKNGTNRFKKTFSNSTTHKNLIKTSKETKFQLESICNYSKENEEHQKLENHQNIENSLKTILRRMMDVKKSNHLIVQEIINKKNLITSKEKLILQLYEDLRYNLNENSKLELNYEDSKRLSNEWEVSRNSIVDYCDNLKNKFFEFVKKIEDFEEKIKELKKEKQQIIRINEAIIEMKSKFY
jgi:hypothetical protein